MINFISFGYHGWVGQFGTIIKPVALSLTIFCITRFITENGGKA